MYWTLLNKKTIQVQQDEYPVMGRCLVRDQGIVQKNNKEMKNKYICNCSRCGREYIVECTEYNYLNGKYRKTCSSFCANSHPMTEDKKNKIRLGVLKYLENQEKPLYVYVCDKCGKEFSTSKKRRSDRNIHCEECIQKRKHFNENPETIMELSKRTISKILNRSRKGCSICGWNESICDIHHIVERCKGG